MARFNHGLFLVTLTPNPSPAEEKGRERVDCLTTHEQLMPASFETSGQIAICPYMAVVISPRAELSRSRKTENRQPKTQN
jgi:hypothetical protein